MMSDPQKDYFEWKHEQGQRPTPRDITRVENVVLPQADFEEAIHFAIAISKDDKWISEEAKGR